MRLAPRSYNGLLLREYEWGEKEGRAVREMGLEGEMMGAGARARHEGVEEVLVVVVKGEARDSASASASGAPVASGHRDSARGVRNVRSVRGVRRVVVGVRGEQGERGD